MRAAKYDGIPSNLTIGFVKEWVRPRISDKRFKHIEGVVKVAVDLAARVGVDSYKAELSAWLHDACKEIKPADLVEAAKAMNVPMTEIEMQQGRLLHGPVAAAVAKKELNITDEAVLKAIAEHTLGAIPMSELSKVVYLADCLEESRPTEYTAPIWKALDVDGSLNLNAAIVKACELGIEHLVESGKTIHPRTVEVKDYYTRLKK